MISLQLAQSVTYGVKPRMAPITVRLNPLGIAVVLVTLVCLMFYITGIPTMFQIETQVNMKELLSASIELAERGGDRVRKISKDHDLKEQVKGETKEGAKEMLTDGDLSSHLAIIHGFEKSFPMLKNRIVSEEHLTEDIDLNSVADVNKHRSDLEFISNTQNVGVNDISIWIDPLDATQEYTEKLNEYVTVLVCVAVRGKPTLGVIHKPFSQETFWGWVGYGHSSNLEAADNVERNPDDPYNIIVSRSHSGDVKEVVSDILGEDTVITPAGGAGYKSMEVVQGRADAYVHVTRIKKWDICSGHAIIDAVRGRMTALDGSSIDYSKTNNEMDAVLEYGLLGTLHEHEKFLKSFESEAAKLKHPGEES